MNKPIPKREIAIISIGHLTRSIIFNATPDAAADVAEFGKLFSTPSAYWLVVDARYDFDEAIAYIENYGKDEAPR